MTFEERIEALTQSLELAARLQMDAAERHDQQIAQHDREIERIDREIERTNRTLRWAIRLGVREARNERKRRQELDRRLTERMEDIAADADRRHRELEELLRRFLARGGNGQH